MKLTIYDLRFTTSARRRDRWAVSTGNHKFALARRSFQPGGAIVNRKSQIVNASAFTLVEIAICLAIIGIALVAIIGILPYGMNTQKANREATVIGQDASVLMPLIAHGSRGADYLTNYVIAITNYYTLYKADGATIQGKGTFGYTYNGVSRSGLVPFNNPYSMSPLTNGANIISVLSTPEFIANAPNYPAVPGVFNNDNISVYSNNVVAYVRSLSGLAAEKPPQTNSIMVDDSFSYQLHVVNAPVAMETNPAVFNQPFNKQLWQNQHELRLTFAWPLLPNNQLPSAHSYHTFRVTVAGQLGLNYNPANGLWFYFYQPQSFAVNTNFTN